ncbi:hypothetical protein S40293_11321 [Stachybotrys chartarum IBT 40293]|nr:hypothetical protein S40293_11321 [Stachybotrys chartarum IBT 40293]
MVRILGIIAFTTWLASGVTAQASDFPYSGDQYWFDALEPLPEDIDPFHAYKKIFFSTVNDTLAWWYTGISIPAVPGLPQAPGLQSQTIQAWRIQHESKTRFRADWTEIIILGDFMTNKDASFYYNAMSGINATVGNYFYDGPITYYIEKNGTDISLEMHQPGAVITHTSVRGGLYNGDRVLFRQVEEKTRNNSDLVSTLIAIGNLDDVRNCTVKNAPADGYYTAFFEGALSSIFGFPIGTTGETRILGNINKKTMDDGSMYPELYEEYQTHFPEFFTDGIITPDWTKILTDAGLPA